MFVLTMALCGVVEYFTSWYLEMTKGIKWWDYSGYLLNLNGRICLEGLLTFAIAGCAFIYLIAPKLDTMLNRIPKGTRFGICGILILLFVRRYRLFPLPSKYRRRYYRLRDAGRAGAFCRIRSGGLRGNDVIGKTCNFPLDFCQQLMYSNVSTR